ncbi:hypothetical protein BFW38_14050 [Terasakiispira papahanaumokuakeensis]|uniref:DUF349 domain-containing protein n=1 Tax=Terasakiispira papahanaumokuakeensis TaxID=197479 RepID=A0A1E2VBV5_9GAMM|nr:DUF349 domain-containing protein [Terasakiispira papahanaumokuakeensis]ODC04488.1 hypothetical protein BFW38_14050 [Terasakiispira papahanaumokuakeensis]
MTSLLIRLAPRLFKPSLRHSDPRIRELALMRLNPEQESERRQLIEFVTHDDSVELKQRALQLLQDIDSLTELLNLSLAEPLHTACRSALVAQLSGQTEDSLKLEQRLDYLATLKDAQILKQLVQEGDNQRLRLQALAQLPDDENLLLEIAIQNRIAKVRQSAAHRITSEAGLETLLQQTRNDKQVQRHARERLQRLRSDAQQREAHYQRAQSLIEQLERHLRIPMDNLFAPKLEHLEQSWSALKAGVTEAQHTQFQQLLQQGQKRWADYQTQQQALAAQARLKAETYQQQKDLVEGLENSLKAFAIELPFPEISLGNLTSQLDISHRHWETLCEQQAPEPKTQKRFDLVQNQLMQLIEAWHRYHQWNTQWQALLERTDDQRAEDIQTLLKEIQWPSHLVAPEPLQRLQADYRELRYPFDQSQPSSAALDDALPDPLPVSHYEAQLDLLEQQLNQGHIKPAGKLYQRLQSQLEELHSAQRPSQGARLRQLGALLAEYKDWQGFVAEPRREALCEHMEQLADDEAMEPRAKAEKIKQLQKEWRELGQAANNKSLWDRFHQASERAYAPCQALFAEEAALRRHNEAQREIICAELEVLSDDAITQLPHEAIEQLIQEAQKEWRRFSPINRNQRKTLEQRFEAALQPLKAQQRHTQNERLAQKEALIEAAEALTQVERSLDAAQEAKSLQQQWKTIGLLPRHEEQPLWQRFRKACDIIFERRDQARTQRKVQGEAQWQQLQKHLVDAEAALNDGQLQQAQQLISKIQIGRHVPQGERKAFEQRLDKLKQQCQAQALGQQRQALWQQWQAMAAEPHTEAAEATTQVQEEAIDQLCLHMAILAELPPRDESEAKKRLALQVSRLADSQQGDLRSADEEAQDLLNQWHALKHQANPTQRQHFEQALQAFCQNS